MARFMPDMKPYLPPEWAPQAALWCGWPHLVDEWGGSLEGPRAHVTGFIRAAAGGLRSGGIFYMVANRHLPYEATLKDVFAHVEMIADEGGYKVIRAIKRKGK